MRRCRKPRSRGRAGSRRRPRSCSAGSRAPRRRRARRSPRPPRWITTIPASCASGAIATPGTRRSTWYFGGGTRNCTIALIVAAGSASLAISSAKRRPDASAAGSGRSAPIRSLREAAASSPLHRVPADRQRLRVGEHAPVRARRASGRPRGTSTGACRASSGRRRLAGVGAGGDQEGVARRRRSRRRARARSRARRTSSAGSARRRSCRGRAASAAAAARRVDLDAVAERRSRRRSRGGRDPRGSAMRPERSAPFGAATLAPMRTRIVGSPTSSSTRKRSSSGSRRRTRP